MYNFALPINTKPARFYLLPKIHKAGVPGRPVISCCGSPTEGISELVDWFIQPLVSSIPSYVKDTNDFLVKIRALGPLAPNSLLVTVDVSALYPSIPHKDGIRNLSLAYYLDKSHFPRESVNAICKLTESLLSKKCI
ncbi:hypothetical protein HOLleu_34224 [Holothuria leucospilota]|uniref:Uncharacterized protein n=1 Tax=Holothuria leucospilota TaxID=206669 RepID=A0A9Q0YTA1_HOLLE|nr:hypothetical protein HOLleu_34224 [Holothuria leucospilota]